MTIDLQVSRLAPGRPLAHFWSVCVGAGRANEGLRAGWQEHLRLAAGECGFQYVRFHGLFHDDMFVYGEGDGRSVYNWQYIDDLFDRMLEIGVRPFVELGFCPAALATEQATVMWWKGHGSPPNDLGKWAELVTQFARHCIARYGLSEVRQWYFEVWNEPNLDPFFRGTKSQYFALYAETARALKLVSADLRVGGPATSNFVPDSRFDGETEDIAAQVSWKTGDFAALAWKPVWLEPFLEFCRREGLPVDFISTHPYPTDFAFDGGGAMRGRTRPVGSTRQDLAWLKEYLARSPYPQAEIHLTEWSSSPSNRDFSHDFLPAAAFVVKACLESSGLVHSLAYWTFTDIVEEMGAGDKIFHGGFGMINFQGIVKPVFHAYRLLHQLGTEELARTDGCVVTRQPESGRLSALAWHYPPEMPDAVPMASTVPEAEAILALGTPRRLYLNLTDLTPGSGFIVETLDQTHGFAFRAWEDMGRPEPPTREQAALLRNAARNTKQEFFAADAQGKLVIDRDIAPWSLIAVRQI